MSVAERAARTKSTLIDHIVRVDLRVRDVDQSLGFYRDVVGLKEQGRSGTRVDLGAPDGTAFLSLDSEGVDAPADPRAAGLFHIAIRFPTRAALGDALARLAGAGYEIGAGDHAVSEALYIDDPDGNGVELYYDRPAEQWPRPTADMIVPMITAPVDLQGLVAAGSGSSAIARPAAPGTDMGHVHLQVGDLDRSARFYADDIGLDLTGRLGDQAAFFSSQGYHHHIGANTWRSRNASPSPRNRAGLTRVVFAVADRDELEALRLRIGDRAHPDRESGVVVEDPDGIELRFVPT